MITIKDAEGRATEVKGRIREFGTRHPLTLATIALVVGLALGWLFG